MGHNNKGIKREKLGLFKSCFDARDALLAVRSREAKLYLFLRFSKKLFLKTHFDAKNVFEFQ